MEEIDYLANERNTAKFDVESMKIVWAGSKHSLEVADRISRLVANDPVSFIFFCTLSEVKKKISLTN